MSGVASALNGLAKLITGYEQKETRVKLNNKGRPIETVEVTKNREPNVTAIMYYLENVDPDNWTRSKMPSEDRGTDWEKALEERTGLSADDFVDNILKQLLPPEVYE